MESISTTAVSFTAARPQAPSPVQRFFDALLDEAVPEHGPLLTVAHLLGAEALLDDWVVAREPAKRCQRLRSRMLDFLLDHPEMRATPWLRCAGTVHEMVETLNRHGAQTL